MAFSKNITARGAQGGYLKLVAYRWDAIAREASATFALYVNKAHADRCLVAGSNERALVETAAKLRLSGDGFDEYLAAAALRSNAQSNGGDVVGRLYQAAKEASRRRVMAGRSDPGLVVVSDFGADLFAAAADA
jgi:hypothetical protein